MLHQAGFPNRILGPSEPACPATGWTGCIAKLKKCIAVLGVGQRLWGLSRARPASKNSQRKPGTLGLAQRYARLSSAWIGNFGRFGASWLLLGLAAPGWGQQAVLASGGLADLPDAPEAQMMGGQQADQTLRVVRGAVLDSNGDSVQGARITLVQDATPERVAVADSKGRFSFVDIGPGPIQLTVTAQGFKTQSIAVVLRESGSDAPQTITMVPEVDMSVTVTPSREEMAQEEVKGEEQQRVLAVIPNFYVSYAQHPVPLSSKQKFELGVRSSTDPVNLLAIGVFAGIQQADNSFSGYGQGAAGYGKRFGANYANLVSSTMISRAMMPSLFKQDPRYFYKGTGTVKSRLMYAIANAVICKGDNGRWQPNYSNILGKLAAGGLSNLYYPPADRNGAALTFENTATSTLGGALGNILQEFVIRRFTPKAPKNVQP